jgi:hypothetical protein
MSDLAILHPLRLKSDLFAFRWVVAIRWAHGQGRAE